MAELPGPLTVNDVPLMLLGVIGALKVTSIALRATGTPATPQAGVEDNTVGCCAGAVVKLQLLGIALTPSELCAAAVMLNANVVLCARFVAGVKVTMLLAAL
jgi:hypothetical protein